MLRPGARAGAAELLGARPQLSRATWVEPRVLRGWPGVREVRLCHKNRKQRCRGHIPPPGNAGPPCGALSCAVLGRGGGGVGTSLLASGEW